MKPFYNYVENNVCEANGYVKWYNKDRVSIMDIIVVIISYIGLRTFLWILSTSGNTDAFEMLDGNLGNLLFILLFIVLTVLSSGVQKIFCILMVYITIVLGDNNGNKAFLLARTVDKNSIIFGEYKETRTEHEN